jgi:hypothetical protein
MANYTDNDNTHSIQEEAFLPPSPRQLDRHELEAGIATAMILPDSLLSLTITFNGKKQGQYQMKTVNGRPTASAAMMYLLQFATTESRSILSPHIKSFIRQQPRRAGPSHAAKC